MRVVVIGSGGREHALANHLSKSADVAVTPGSDGIPKSIRTPAKDLYADLFVFGPEQPLVSGEADVLREQGKVVFGPNHDGAQLEGSKIWMKELFRDANIPTARWGAFTSEKDAIEFLDTLDGAYVIKTDGLAAGKGVFVTDDRDAAIADIREKLSGESFGESGKRLVIEECMTGPEFSVFAICDGTKAVTLPAAQDHKRIGDGDTGPNTGGIGAYSPVPFLPDDILDVVMETCIDPTIAALCARGIDYRGVLYAGLMLTADGPKMIEYNIRFGDPEIQVVLPRLRTDLATLLLEAAAGDIKTQPIIEDNACINIVLCAENYPGTPRIGDEIVGIDKAELVEGVSVLHAGTKRDAQGRWLTNGGRVLNVVATAATIAEAREKAYEAVSYIAWPGMHYRTDIAAQAIA